MSKYRITPKRKKWIVQRIEDRKTCGKPFKLKAEAEIFMLKLMAKAPAENQPQSKLKIIEAFKTFVDYQFDKAKPGSRFNKTSANAYKVEYDLRISKFMPDKYLSEFNILVMEDYLTNCHEASYPYKTLKRSVRLIKTFIKRMAAIGTNPCVDMLEFKVHEFQKIVPDNDDLMFTKQVELIDDQKVMEIISEYYKNLWNDPHAANTFAIFSMLFLFGLRASELSGIKRSAIDFENRILNIKGVYIPAEGGFLNRTKNRGSRRPIPIGDDAIQFLNVWLTYLEKNYKYSIWLFPSMKGDGPLCYKYINAHVWKAYAKMGLAKIECRKDGHVKIVSSPLKYYPTKIFRHRLGSHLIEAMNKYNELSKNEVKRIIGHTQYSTTAEIYGNKIVRGTPEERDALARVKEKASKANLLTQVISQK
jgi:integrase|tara:strand:+ start:263 stop:1519 length:1257 start_codon:yes stop_codon:yes gene_type:complete